DAAAALSVQVHPTDEHASRSEAGARGKTEAWVVLHAAPGSRIYAGLKPGVTAAAIRVALAEKRMADCLHTFAPVAGDCVFLAAGTVHALGADLLIFEAQQTSDITYRLHDWDRVDTKTGRPRPLHVEESLACTNFDSGPCHPVRPVPEAPGRERLVDCNYFRLWRVRAESEFPVGAIGECRIVVAVDGDARLSAGGHDYPLRPGDVYLLPAELGAARCRANGRATLLEVGLPRCAST
ncbi:MAG: class I mannose-6-phosphate isomerase, partial [Gemmataceae bacterium]